MKHNKIFPALLGAALLATGATSCLKDGDDTILLDENIIEEEIFFQPAPDVSINNNAVVVTSSETKSLGFNDFVITVPAGAVPHTTTGGDGRVAFSASTVTSLPAALPTGYTAVSGSAIKVEPMHFVFNSPLTIAVPTFGLDASTLTLLHYNQATGKWDVVPWSYIGSNDKMYASVLELGYFVLATNTTGTSLGGVRILKQYIQSGYTYYLTLTPASGNAGNVRRVSFASNGTNLYMSNVSMGTYKVTLTRCANGATTLETFDQDLAVNVETPLTPGPGGYVTYQGWTDIVPDNGNWRAERPSGEWGGETATYGTGRFQATLSWVNTAGSGTDYDLHLFGPNNLHVYFSNKRQGSFELDRDWLTESGNAVENIYSINNSFTPGTYTVKVHHYSGTTGKNFNCRVLLDGVPQRSVSSAIYSNKQYEEIFTFTIY